MKVCNACGEPKVAWAVYLMGTEEDKDSENLLLCSDCFKSSWKLLIKFLKESEHGKEETKA